MQVIVLMPLFLIILPANAGAFFLEMMKIAAFDYFDTSPYLDKMLGLKPTTAQSTNFEALGFESLYVLHNLGTLFLVFLVYILAGILS